MLNKLRRLSLAALVLAAGVNGVLQKFIHTASSVTGGGRHFG